MQKEVVVVLPATAGLRASTTDQGAHGLQWCSQINVMAGAAASLSNAAWHYTAVPTIISITLHTSTQDLDHTFT